MDEESIYLLKTCSEQMVHKQLYIDNTGNRNLFDTVLYMTFDGTQFLTILIVIIKYLCFRHAKFKCNDIGYVKSQRKYKRLLLIAVMSRLLLNQ